MSTPKEIKLGQAWWEILRNCAFTVVLVLIALRLDGWLEVAAWVLVVNHGILAFLSIAGLGMAIDRVNSKVNR